MLAARAPQAITVKSYSCRKSAIILSLSMQRCYERRIVVMDVIAFPENLYTTSGVSILLHGVISLPDTTPYDKIRERLLNPTRLLP